MVREEESGSTTCWIAKDSDGLPARGTELPLSAQNHQVHTPSTQLTEYSANKFR
jgi:hypothetical protein